ncbi:MAG: c-type cytochrome [Bacteroidetes bacterium]|nr:c-type cytochrome [Bacteroidota bacterium]
MSTKQFSTHLVLFLSSFLFFSVTISSAQDAAAGKTVFMSKCAACHNVLKKGTGPAMAGLEERHKWADHNELLAWINNPTAYMANDPYTQGLKTEYGSMMPGFTDVTLQDVENIVAYINEAAKPAPTPAAGTGEVVEAGGGNSIFFGAISLLLGVIILILMRVNSNLRKIADQTEGVITPKGISFWRNKRYITLISIGLFIFGGYMMAKGAIGLGNQKDYQPVQPIYYSHKVHAGINQVNCLYCHGSAEQSKHATIPAVNTCMNCHKAIQTYEKGPKLLDGDGNVVDGTAEIQKLYEYAGFDPNQPNKWNPSMIKKPIEWVKIHNLPDHVYFNHSQHVNAGKVQCQSCHGAVDGMNEVKQVADLSMGWCVNCHRETNVQFNYDSTKGNKFYSIYEKFHSDLKSGKMDSVKVKDIGGLECQKCHY